MMCAKKAACCTAGRTTVGPPQPHLLRDSATLLCATKPSLQPRPGISRYRRDSTVEEERGANTRRPTQPGKTSLSRTWVSWDHLLSEEQRQTHTQRFPFLQRIWAVGLGCQEKGFPGDQVSPKHRASDERHKFKRPTGYLWGY